MACRYAADISEPDKRKCADALYHSAEIYYSDRLYSLAMNQYLEALKLSEHYGGYTIKAISESVGYKSQANFISVFTKVTWMKPSIYQKLSKE